MIIVNPAPKSINHNVSSRCELKRDSTPYELFVKIENGIKKEFGVERHDHDYKPDDVLVSIFGYPHPWLSDKAEVMLRQAVGVHDFGAEITVAGLRESPRLSDEGMALKMEKILGDVLFPNSYGSSCSLIERTTKIHGFKSPLDTRDTNGIKVRFVCYDAKPIFKGDEKHPKFKGIINWSYRSLMKDQGGNVMQLDMTPSGWMPEFAVVGHWDESKDSSTWHDGSLDRTRDLAEKYCADKESPLMTMGT